MLIPVPVPVHRRADPGAPPAQPREVEQVRAAVSSILGSLSGGPHLPESGLNWAVAYVTRGSEALLVVATSDAGWLPPGTLVPAGVRVLWNVSAALAWATVDDPVRQVIEFADHDGYTLHAVATTHPSRIHHIPYGPWKLVGERHPGQVVRESIGRLDVVASSARVAKVRAMAADEADRQCRALLQDLERIEIDPAHTLGDLQARRDVRRYLRAGRAVPARVLDQLRGDDEALADALRQRRTSARALSYDSPPPPHHDLRDRLLERAMVAVALAAADHDVASAVYAWTFARHLAR